MKGMKALLSFKDLAIGYGKQGIIHCPNFSVQEGDFLCIVGENGSGKSTLLKTIVGFQKPANGEINWTEKGKRKGIGYLPQQTSIPSRFPASVEEVVLSGFQENRCLFYSKKEKELAKGIMLRIGLSDAVTKRCYHELSGGQQQCVLLARALCAARKILLLDEPTTGMDIETAQNTYCLLKQLNSQKKLTIIMVTHDNYALQYASHILSLGKKAKYSRANEYIRG